MENTLRLGMAVLLGSSLWLAGGLASATTILPNSGGEPSLATPGGILDSLYSLGNLTRMDDSLDQKWENTGLAHVVVVAKYAGYSQTLGYLPGDTGAVFVPLLTVTDTGAIDGTEITFTSDESGADFRWGDDPNGGAVAPGLYSAREDGNADLRDHMVTWLITGNDGHPGNRLGAYVVAFEDLFGLGDRDYNDLVVLVWGVTDGPLVPAPASLLLVAVAMVGGGCWRRLRG
jgi:uncharacterized protein DUF4114